MSTEKRAVNRTVPAARPDVVEINPADGSLAIAWQLRSLLVGAAQLVAHQIACMDGELVDHDLEAAKAYLDRTADEARKVASALDPLTGPNPKPSCALDALQLNRNLKARIVAALAQLDALDCRDDNPGHIWDALNLLEVTESVRQRFEDEALQLHRRLAPKVVA